MSTVMCTRFLRTRNVAEARLWQKVIRVCTEGMNYQASVVRLKVNSKTHIFMMQNRTCAITTQRLLLNCQCPENAFGIYSLQ